VEEVAAVPVAHGCGLLILGAGDRLDEIDDGSPKLCVWNLHEGFRQLEPVRRGEIVVYVLRRRCIGLCVVPYPRVRCSFKEELHRDL
jgi:hypothetical protein